MKKFDPVKTAKRVAQTLPADLSPRSGLHAGVALEGLLYFFDASHEDGYLDRVKDVVKHPAGTALEAYGKNDFFTGLNFSIYLRTGDKKYIVDFEEQSQKLLNSLPRDTNEGVCHPSSPESGRLLVELLRDYAVRMARTGWLSGNTDYFRECMNQYQIYRNALRNGSTGLWHRGLNWNREMKGPDPGHWNRTQGLVLGGMVDSLEYLPEDSIHHEMMMKMLHEFTDDLLRYQDARGLWHQLTDQPEAYQETGGTSLIVHSLYKAFHRNWLSRDPYLSAAERAMNPLLGFVMEDGRLMNASLDVDPGAAVEDYKYRPALPGTLFSAGCMLMACSGPYLARSPVDMS